MSEERTEEASPQRLREARRRGQAARSQEWSHACSLLASVLALSALTPAFFGGLQQLVRLRLQRLGDLQIPDLYDSGGKLLAGLLLASVVGGLLAQWSTVGVMWTLHPLKPDLQRLNPVSNGQRWFSAKMLVDAGKMLLKLLLLMALSWTFVTQQVLRDLGSGDPLHSFLDHLWVWLKKVAALACVIGVLDVLYQRWEFRKGLRMSKYDLKQEYRQQEGDPHRKWRARALGRKLIKQRSLAGVSKASVVITNPTHLAVALEFHFGIAAPRVVAKGADNVALSIRKLARKHQIPIVENKPLARALYPLEVEETIPPELFGPVAEILVALARAEQS